MAKIRTGPLAAQISGSIAGQTFSHNRGGAYVRNRSIPVTSTTPAALLQKATLTAASQAFAGLTPAQRLSWQEWARENPRIDTLGESRTMTGQQAYIGNRIRMVKIAEIPLTTPPNTPAPPPLTTLVGQYDIGTGMFDVAWTPTPLQAGEHLWVQGTVVNSDAINYVQNLLRFVVAGGDASVSPRDFQTELEAIFGTLTAGQNVTWIVSVFDDLTGQLSAPLRIDGIVIDTP